MYTVATARLSAAVEAPFLAAIPRVSVWVALVAWTLTAYGLAASLFRVARASSSGAAVHRP